MDCARCEELLIASLDGRAAASEGNVAAARGPHGEHPGSEQKGAPRMPAGGARSTGIQETIDMIAETDDLRAHLAGCERCRGFERLLANAPEAVPPADLTESILAATSSRWASVFEQLNADLPCLASMEPDAAFMNDVLAATSGRGDVGFQQEHTDRARFDAFRPLLAGYRRFAARGARPAIRPYLSALWQRLVRRPRLALEGAWVGALALALLVGAPVARIDASPVEALAEIRQERVEPAIDSALDQLGAIGSQAQTAAATRARGVWTNRVVPALETGRRVWCESFGCGPTDDDTNDTDREPMGDINTNESNRGGTDER